MRTKTLGSFVPVSVGLSVTLLLILACLVRAKALEFPALAGYDLLVHQRGAIPPPANLLIVDFDEASVAALACYPIARRTLASVVEQIEAGHPRIVGLDLLLSEKRCGEDDDSQLAAVFQQAGNVILVDTFPDADLAAAEPLPLFRRSALDVGFVNVPVDRDGVIRRVFLARKAADNPEGSFALTVASYYSDATIHTCGSQGICLGDKPVWLDGPGSDTVLIGVWNTPAARAVSAGEVLKSGFDPRVFEDKIVLLGQSSSKGKDLFATPGFRFAQQGRSFSSGTEIQAAAIQTLLTGSSIRVLRRWPQWLLNFALIWIVLSLVLRLRPVYGVPAALAVMFGVYLFAQFMFSAHHTSIHFVSCEAGLALAMPVGLGYRFLEERRLRAASQAERRETLKLFERYVSPEVVAEIWNRRNELVLAGHERVATVMFSDIRNFTGLTAGKPTPEVFAWLNSYLTAMSAIVTLNRGFLNKFIGDGIMVVFGVPLSEGVEQDACRAAHTALQMLERVQQLNAARLPEWPELRIGIGIHTGKLMVGSVGACERLEYSVIGETVNLASRLESLTKELGAGIAISPATQQLIAPQFATPALGHAIIRGYHEQTLIYTIADNTSSGVAA